SRQTAELRVSRRGDSHGSGRPAAGPGRVTATVRSSFPCAQSLRIECGGVMADLLQVWNVNKHYGGVCALKNARFALGAGEVHALIGENGAGKSTLSRIVAGSVRADNAII